MYVEFKRHPVLKHYIRDCQEKEQADLGVHTPSHDNSTKWTVEKMADNSVLCDLENMLSEEEKSLKYFGLPLADLHKEQYIRNCSRVDKYVAEEGDFLPDNERLYFDANYNKLNKDQ